VLWRLGRGGSQKSEKWGYRRRETLERVEMEREKIHLGMSVIHHEGRRGGQERSRKEGPGAQSVSCQTYWKKGGATKLPVRGGGGRVK